MSVTVSPANAVRMIQRRERLRLALEACEPPRIRGKELGENLQRDIALQPPVARAIHLAHSSRADGGQNSVRTEPGSGFDGHEVASHYMAPGPNAGIR